jgi:hypothetical protein
MPLELNKKALDFLVNNPRGPVGIYLYRKGLKIKALARRQVGVDTGSLKSSIHVRRGRTGIGQYVEIGSNKNHAYLHHEGTKPHVILPNTAKQLRFVASGRMVYTRKVLHPGTKANRYLSDQLYVIR